MQTGIGSRIGSGTVISTPTGIAMEQGTETGRETQMVQGAGGKEIVRGIEPPSPLDWAMATPSQRALCTNHAGCTLQLQMWVLTNTKDLSVRRESAEW